MTSEQNALLSTAQSVSRFLETLTATDLPPAFAAARVALKTDLSRIAALANAQAQPLGGLTRHRDGVFDAGVEVTLIVADLVRGYARRAGLVELAAKVEITPSDLSRGRFSRRVQLMQQVYEATAGLAAAELAALGLTEARLAELKAKADAAEALHDVPRDAIAARRVITRQLRELISELRSRLRDELDPHMAARRVSDPVAYERYQAARIVIQRSGASADADETDTTATAETTAALADGGTTTATTAKLAA